jgi:glycolate oxidase
VPVGDDLVAALTAIAGAENVLTGDRIADDYTHDEALTVAHQSPVAVVKPAATDDVAAILRLANASGVPVTARGSGTGLSGAAQPQPGGVVVSFERMNRVLEIDEQNHVAVVQPGVTLAELDEVTAAHRLVYPVYPGEYSASLGGNVATNAGGMRAVKYGVTRHQVLGVEAVLATGEVIRTGGRYVKSSTGYDLTQLIIGSEGSLAFVTEALLRLYPRPAYNATVLAPFRSLDDVMNAVPRVVASGVGPLILEYIDTLTMAGMTRTMGADIGVPDDVKEATVAYLVVMMENAIESRLDEDVQTVSEQLVELGGLDAYVLPSTSATQLIEARERAFWLAKAANADDIVDVVVPRASIAEFMARVAELADSHATFVAGCGHAGDGNIHMSVFQKDDEVRHKFLRSMFELGMSLGGAISGEHGIGRAKKKYFLELEDPVKVELMRRIKSAFDPNNILNPGVLF